MDGMPKDPLGRKRRWDNPVTEARQKKRISKRKQERVNRKKGRK